MMNLPEASLVPLDPRLLTPPSEISLTRQQTRVMQILQKGSKNALGTTPKTWSLEFFRSPIALSPPSPTNPSSTLTLAHTAVDPTTRRAVPTGKTSTLNTSLVITSLGFRAEPISPFYDPALGHLRVIAGRVAQSSGTALRNVYASGWAATGAKGVLASTMIDAYAVADTILSDWLSKGEVAHTTPVSAPSEQQDDGRGACLETNSDPHPDDPPPEVQAGLEEGAVTEYGDWKAVDAEETRRGEALGKERERMGWEEARTFLASRPMV
jgi:adrenodoxin-NADP+ reductase